MPAKWVLDTLKMTPEQWGRLPYDPATGKSPERDELIAKARRIREGGSADDDESDTQPAQQQPQQQRRSRGADDTARRLDDIEGRLKKLEQGGAGPTPEQTPRP